VAVYRNISLSFWTDSKVEDTFTPEDKYMYLYLLTNPHTNICGCYEVSVKQISRQTGYNEESVERILDRMERAHKVICYCKATKEMLIFNWGRYNWTKSDKLIKPISAAIEQIKHKPFQSYVRLLYENIDNIHTVSIPYPYGMDTTVTVSVTDTVPGTVQDKPLKVPKELKPKRAGVHPMFDTFWQAYPKRIAKAKAEEAFSKLNPDEELMKVMLAALKAWSKTDQWTKESGQFVPNPTTWINQRRWEDELPKDNKPKEKPIIMMN